ncbi:group 1 glycosyl transferase [Natrialba hulunbeirensis JCM 10989]|uniref:Group 1 glycosyl transferase n=2 Tax=Natrialba hulunbeirensis TaxID=123783 RepID=M0ACS0_9EURY|nr:group 1 glycosyl transferase [Natrialba hulunbeirensis JCM 10989]
MLFHISDHLTKKGYNVDFLVSNASGDFADKVPEGVSLINLKSDRELASLPKISRYLRKTEPDILLSTTHSSIVIAHLSLIISNCETEMISRQGTVLTKHFENQDGIKNKIVYELMKHLIPRADKVIAISEGVKTDLVQCTGLSESDISVIYNPAITSVADIEQKAQEETEHPWLSQKDNPVILGAGRLVQQKGFSTLLRAFKSITDTRDCRLIILGEGEDRGKLENYAKELGIYDLVSLPGYIDNPYSYMGSADVFALSSEWEGFGIVLVEAMACGTPVVSTDCESGPEEILENGRFGPLVNVGNYEQLADSIQDMLDDPIPGSMLKQRAEDFDLDNVQQYEEIIYE